MSARLNKRELLGTAGMEELLADEKEEAKPDEHEPTRKMGENIPS